jgi:hypothetical protein
MLLVQLTVNGSIRYVSIDGHSLTHNWRPFITGMEAPRIYLPTHHGGYAQLTWGSISFDPALFSSTVESWTDWPPPASCAITASHTDTDEASATLIFAGTAYLASPGTEKVTYDLYGPSYDETVGAMAYNNTLNSVMTSILTTIPEITIVDTSAARSPSPNVAFTTSGSQLAIDLASEVAGFYSHLFYIVGSTAYLVDMLADNGSMAALTEFEFFEFPTYTYSPKAKAVAGNYTRYSAYPLGGDLSATPYHTTQANIEAALDDILTVENAPRASVNLPMAAGNFPTFGEKITFPDTSQAADLSTWIRARNVTFDFMQEIITIEGEGAIAAG